MSTIKVRLGNIQNEDDQKFMLKMLDLYMRDPMGGEKPLAEDLALKNIEGLKKQMNYVFFLATYNEEVVGLANCFVNFSTFKGKQLINIHDFAVDSKVRRKGIGRAMMNRIIDYCKDKDMCKITLEVRDDNPGAQKLYMEAGFASADPFYHFWEKVIS